MNRALRSFLFAILAFAAGTWLLCKPRERPASAGAAAGAPISAPPSAGAANGAPSANETVAAPAASRTSAPSRGFRSLARLEEHFSKHGREFKATSAAQYLALAQALRDAPVGGDVLELIRPGDGVVSRFDKRSGAFLAFDADGTIRTFFRPNDGEAYFRRQDRRVPQ
jgi:hypothetical protein